MPGSLASCILPSNSPMNSHQSYPLSPPFSHDGGSSEVSWERQEWPPPSEMLRRLCDDINPTEADKEAIQWLSSQPEYTLDYQRYAAEKCVSAGRWASLEKKLVQWHRVHGPLYGFAPAKVLVEKAKSIFISDPEYEGQTMPKFSPSWIKGFMVRNFEKILRPRDPTHSPSEDPLRKPLPRTLEHERYNSHNGCLDMPEPNSRAGESVRDDPTNNRHMEGDSTAQPCIGAPHSHETETRPELSSQPNVSDRCIDHCPNTVHSRSDFSSPTERACPQNTLNTPCSSQEASIRSSSEVRRISHMGEFSDQNPQGLAPRPQTSSCNGNAPARVTQRAYTLDDGRPLINGTFNNSRGVERPQLVAAATLPQGANTVNKQGWESSSAVHNPQRANESSSVNTTREANAMNQLRGEFRYTFSSRNDVTGGMNMGIIDQTRFRGRAIPTGISHNMAIHNRRNCEFDFSGDATTISAGERLDATRGVSCEDMHTSDYSSATPDSCNDHFARHEIDTPYVRNLEAAKVINNESMESHIGVMSKEHRRRHKRKRSHKSRCVRLQDGLKLESAASRPYSPQSSACVSQYLSDSDDEVTPAITPKRRKRYGSKSIKPQRELIEVLSCSDDEAGAVGYAHCAIEVGSCSENEEEGFVPVKKAHTKTENFADESTLESAADEGSRARSRFMAIVLPPGALLPPNDPPYQAQIEFQDDALDVWSDHSSLTRESYMGVAADGLKTRVACMGNMQSAGDSLVGQDGGLKVVKEKESSDNSCCYSRGSSSDPDKDYRTAQENFAVGCRHLRESQPSGNEVYKTANECFSGEKGFCEVESLPLNSLCCRGACVRERPLFVLDVEYDSDRRSSTPEAGPTCRSPSLGIVPARSTSKIQEGDMLENTPGDNVQDKHSEDLDVLAQQIADFISNTAEEENEKGERRKARQLRRARKAAARARKEDRKITST